VVKQSLLVKLSWNPETIARKGQQSLNFRTEFLVFYRYQDHGFRGVENILLILTLLEPV
jgi:hypothetical protein